MKKSIFVPWLTRFYGWYFKTRHARPPRQENLCHFGRVVFFWAPLYWFFCRCLRWGIRPWMLVTLAFLASLAAISPLLAGYVVSIVAFMAIGSFLLGALLAFEFWKIEITRRVRLWMVLAVVLLAGSSYFWPDETLTVILVVAFLAALAGVVFAALWLVYWIVKILIGGIIRIWEKVPKPHFHVSLPAGGFIPRPVRNVATNVGGIFSMVWHFLVALEHRTLCPWLTFQDGRIEFYWSANPAESK